METGLGVPITIDPIACSMPNDDVAFVGIAAHKALRQGAVLKNFESLLANYGYAGKYTPIENKWEKEE